MEGTKENYFLFCLKILIFSIIISQHSSEFQISQENKISSLNCFFIDNLPVMQMKSVKWGKKGEVFDKPKEKGQ